jgi:hypothetical protein
MGRRGLRLALTRMARLETALAPEAATAAEAERAAAWAAWEAQQARRAMVARELGATMHPDHIARVRDHWTGTRDAQSDPGGAWLATIVESMLYWAAAPHLYEWDRRLALPAAVAEVYLATPGVWPAARCGACQLPMPWRQMAPGDRYWLEASGPLFFERCPDCGGPVAPAGRRTA